MTTPSDPLDLSSIPEIDLNITTQVVTAKPRKLKTSWSVAAADDLRDLWGGPSWWPRLPDNPLDLLKDALEDPDYDPDSETPYKGLWRHEDGRIATPEEVEKAHPENKLISDMADEMTKEIDREILATLMAGATSPDVAPLGSTFFNLDNNTTHIATGVKDDLEIPVEVRNAIELSPVPRHMKDAALEALAAGARRLENLP